jgi:hypothetical protein
MPVNCCILPWFSWKQRCNDWSSPHGLAQNSLQGKASKHFRSFFPHINLSPKYMKTASAHCMGATLWSSPRCSQFLPQLFCEASQGSTESIPDQAPTACQIRYQQPVHNQRRTGFMLKLSMHAMLWNCSWRSNHMKICISTFYPNLVH